MKEPVGDGDAAVGDGVCDANRTGDPRLGPQHRADYNNRPQAGEKAGQEHQGFLCCRHFLREINSLG